MTLPVGPSHLEQERFSGTELPITPWVYVGAARALLAHLLLQIALPTRAQVYIVTTVDLAFAVLSVAGGSRYLANTNRRNLD